MQYHFYLFRSNIENIAGLYHFEGFIHQTGRVDGHFGTHAPIGVFQGVLQSRPGYIFHAPITECSAAGGNKKIFDLALRSTGKTLENRRVFAVDRDEFCIGRCRHFTADDLTCHNHDFFAGQSNGLSGPDRCNDRFKSARSDNGTDDNIGFGGGYSLHHGFPSSLALDSGGKFLLQFASQFFIGSDNRTGLEKSRLPCQLVQIIPCDKRNNFKLVGKLFQNFGSTQTDRACGSQHDNAFFLHFDSIIRVTGPSLWISTFISPPNFPVATFTP